MNKYGSNIQIIPKTLDIKTFILLIISVIAMFLFRSIWTAPIEFGGDAVRKFFFAAEIVRTGDWTILLQNHHTMRWSILLPQTFITWVVGTRYEVYYILPLLSFALYFVIILYALKDHLNTSQKILLGALLFVDPLSFRDSSQLLTNGPGIFFAISACYMLSTYSSRGHLAIVSAAFLFFCSYGAHATYVSFAVGGFIWLVFIQREWKPALIFAGTLIGLLIIECLYFNYLSDWDLTFGRIEALFFGKHLKGVPGVGRYTVTFSQLFTRWGQLPAINILLCMIFFISTLVFISLKKKPVLPKFVSCAYVVGLCFALFVTFAVVSIDPLNPVQRLLPRYLTPFLPFLIIVSIYSISLITIPNRKVWDIRMEILAGLLMFTILAVPQAFDHSGTRPIIKIRPSAVFWIAEREYSNFADEYSKGSLIIKGSKRRVLKMIALFKRSGEERSRANGQSTAKNKAPVKCVSRLVRIPLSLNYHKCK